ncbi:MAG: hypothetical protein J7521_17510 [Caulobacter sp.]|nr:hypothetical protein [Caulobacter sp.]
MRPALAVLATLFLAGCGPRPAEQAEICAIFALPGTPGDTRMGTPADLAWAGVHEKALFKSGVIYAPGWQVMGHGRSWGRCPTRARPIQNLLVSPDHTYAMTKGGRRENGRPVSFGSCYYQKGPAGWRLRACRQTLNEAVPLMTLKPLK